MMLLLTGQDMQQDDKHFLYVTRGIFWATISRPGLKRVGWDPRVSVKCKDNNFPNLGHPATVSDVVQHL